jgi:hypothetical protein
MFDDFELSHLSFRVLGLEFLFCWHCEELAHLDRCAAGDDGFASPRHGLIHVGCVEYPKAANVFLGLKVWSRRENFISGKQVFLCLALVETIDAGSDEHADTISVSVYGFIGET